MEKLSHGHTLQRNRVWLGTPAQFLDSSALKPEEHNPEKQKAG